jgi:hypothetical protein
LKGSALRCFLSLGAARRKSGVYEKVNEHFSTSWNDESEDISEEEKLSIEAPVNGGRNYNGPKVAKFLVG